MASRGPNSSSPAALGRSARRWTWVLQSRAWEKKKEHANDLYVLKEAEIADHLGKHFVGPEPVSYRSPSALDLLPNSATAYVCVFCCLLIVRCGVLHDSAAHAERSKAMCPSAT
ncbi:hypothetical protein QYF61_021429 [Mycteria americana]|uniref:Uncharacterized protein n=1 Tax=Mycteria americana TaxID=33587 RepID=A0AAN7RY36_MYCAM|nr:hypothetical protein QYF61_021429 [Mycteria americana]